MSIIDELDLSTRTCNALLRAGKKKVGGVDDESKDS